MIWSAVFLLRFIASSFCWPEFTPNRITRRGKVTSDRSENVENEATGQHCHNDVFSKKSEVRAAFLDRFVDIDQVAKRSRQAAFLLNSDDVAIIGLVEKAIKLRPFSE